MLVPNRSVTIACPFHSRQPQGQPGQIVTPFSTPPTHPSRDISLFLWSVLSGFSDGAASAPQGPAVVGGKQNGRQRGRRRRRQQQRRDRGACPCRSSWQHAGTQRSAATAAGGRAPGIKPPQPPPQHQFTDPPRNYQHEIRE